MSTVLKLACTHNPLTRQYPAQEITPSHLAGTTDPQEGHQHGTCKEIRREDQATTTQEDLETQTAKWHKAAQGLRNHTPEVHGDLQGSPGQHPIPHCKTKVHNDKRQPQAAQTSDITSKRREDPATATHGGTENSADRTHSARRDRPRNSPTHRLHSHDEEDLNPSTNGKLIEHN